MKTVGICTLGCKVNAYESEFIKSELEKAGYQIVNFDTKCDVYIINTCSVTNTSDSKSRKMIHKAIRENKDACTVVMGCFLEAHQDYEEDGVSIYLGNTSKSQIVSLLDEYFVKQEPIQVPFVKTKTKFEDMYIDKFEDRTRAFVKIQDGCENFCAYCIIPYVRGKCRSKDPSIVLKEIKSLVDNGYQEIVLTGIHTGNYGVDLGSSFAKLLEDICKIKGLKRLRISSIEITELNDNVLKVIENNSIIVDHLHIPIQSGCNKTLKDMNRKYNIDFFKNKVKQIRNIRPDISLTTDLIVGFPNETDEDFKESLASCSEIGFTSLHVFPYSVRSGTAAAKFPNKIEPSKKKERVHEALCLSKELEVSYYEKMLGTEQAVLIETTRNGYSYGHTSNYLYVKIKGEFEKETFISVKIEKIDYPYLVGIEKIPCQN